MATRDALFRALGGLHFEVVPETVVDEGARLLFLGRLRAGNAPWLRAMQAMHEAAKTFKVDTSKVYFLSAGQLIFGWRIIIQADDVSRAVSDLAAALETALTRASTVDEYPLPGATADRNAPIGGRRGAGPIGTIPLGPMALQIKRMGG